MSQDTGVLAFSRVDAYEAHGGEGPVEPVHHAELTGPGADEASALVEQLEVDVLGVAVRVGHQDLGGAGVECALNGGVHSRVMRRRYFSYSAPLEADWILVATPPIPSMSAEI